MWVFLLRVRVPIICVYQRLPPPPVKIWGLKKFDIVNTSDAAFGLSLHACRYSAFTYSVSEHAALDWQRSGV